VVLRSKVWVTTVGLLCVSMAARAEYKEVWNPPEASQKVRHAGHAKPVAVGASKKGNHTKPAPHVKPVASSGAKPKAKAAHVAAAVKSTPAPAHAKHVEAVAKPRQVAQSNAPQAVSAQPPRELPPILH